MSDKEVSRRGYTKYAAAGVVIVAVAGAGAYYASRPPPSTPAPTTQVQTQTVKETVTQTAKPTATETGITAEKRWKPDPAITGRKINFISSAEAYLTGIAGSLTEYIDLSGNDVTIQTIGFEYRQKFMLELTATDTAYDVMSGNSARMGEHSPYFMEISDWIERDNDVIVHEDYPPMAQSLCQYTMPGEETRTIGLPLGVYDVYSWYRSDVLEALGVQYPENVDGVIDIFDRLGMEPGHKPVHNEITGEDDLSGIVMYSSLPFAPTCWYIYFANAQGANWFDPDTGALAVNDDLAIDSLEWQSKLWQYGPPGQETLDWSGCAAFYDAGKAVFTLAILAEHYLNHIDPASRVFGKSWPNIVWQNPDPNSPYRKRGIRRGTTAGCWQANIPDNISDSRKEAAWDYIKWMTDAGRELERENADSGRVSVLNVLTKMPKYSRFLKYSNENREYGTIGPPDPNTPLPELGQGFGYLRMPYASKFYDMMDPNITECLFGNLDAKTALDNSYAEMIKIEPSLAK